MWKQVTIKEFEVFIDHYPAKLVKVTCHACVPVTVSYNDYNKDFSEIGSIVLSEPNKYFIKDVN